MAVQDWSSVAANNTSVGGINTDGNVTLVNQIDNMFRGMMADVRTGIDGGYFINATYAAKTGNYTALEADRGKLIHFTAAATLTLTAAATLTAGWWIMIRARGGDVVVDPNSTELINAKDTLTIANGSSAIIFCDATGFYTVADSQGYVRNRVVNPAMQISQENGNTAGTTNVYYAADQWHTGFVSSAGTITSQRVQSVTPNGSKDRYRVTITVADASLAAGEYLIIRQPIEGSRVADFQYGTAAAKQAVVRFGFKGPAGTYAVSLNNSVPNRSYVALFTIAGGQANTDTEQTLTIPGDTSGTWLTDGSVGIFLQICLAAGTTLQGTVGWQANNVLGTSAVTNGMGTGGNVFEVFDVGLYLGGTAPKWELNSTDDDLRECKRYYETVGDKAFLFSGNVTSASTYSTASLWGVQKRTGTPVISGTVNGAALFPNVVGTLGGNQYGFQETRTANATGAGGIYSSIVVGNARF